MSVTPSVLPEPQFEAVYPLHSWFPIAGNHGPGYLARACMKSAICGAEVDVWPEAGGAVENW